jgi:hypothetical protein
LSHPNFYHYITFGSNYANTINYNRFDEDHSTSLICVVI